jgi:FkbM family methyltransferase
MAPRFFPDPETGQGILDIPRLLAKHRLRVRGVVHVGAHTCQELPLYRSLGIPKILFIEANPDICARIRRENASDPAVRIENFAISDANGSLTLHIMSESQSSSILPLKHHKDYYPEIHQIRDLVVPARRLDSMFGEMGLDPRDYNYLHLDIQGAELLALRGAASLMAHFDVVSTELNFDELYEGCALAEDLEDFLACHDFHPATVLCPCSPSWGDALFVRGPFLTPHRTSVRFLGRTATNAPIVSFGGQE